MNHYAALTAEQLRRPDVSVGRALSNDVLMVRGKIFGFLKDDRLVVKLPAPRVARLIESRAAIPFTSGGRIMKEWAAVAAPTPLDVNFWRTLLDDARKYVASASPVLRRRNRKQGTTACA